MLFPTLSPNIPLEAVCQRLVPDHPQADEKGQQAIEKHRDLVHLALLLAQETPHRILEASLETSSPVVHHQLQVYLEHHSREIGDSGAAPLLPRAFSA